jgi:hypothetical protein
VDSEADKYYKTHNTVIKNSLPDVLHLKTPMTDVNDEVDGNGVDTHSHESERSAASPEPEVNYV